MNTVTIPVSLFGTIFERRAFNFDRWTWDQTLELLEDAAKTPTAQKQDAFLFAPVEFRGHRRRKSNALKSGMVVLDVDSGLHLGEAAERLRDLQLLGLIYTTASHKPEHNKFRVLVPLDQEIDATLYPSIWAQLNEQFGDAADPSKKGAESLFYLPGCYPGVENQILLFEGAPYRPAPIPVKEALPPPSPPSERQKSVSQYRTRSADLTREDIVGRRAHENPLLTEETLDEYLDTTVNWHHARFRTMCRIAGRAKRLGYSLTAWELREVFNQVDLLDGSYYSDVESQRKLLSDAERALGFVG